MYLKGKICAKNIKDIGKKNCGDTIEHKETKVENQKIRFRHIFT